MLVTLFGPPAIVSEGKRFETRSRKAMALLAYLSMQAGQPVTRAHLANLLWERSGEEQARTSLRQSLSLLRKLFRDAGGAPLEQCGDLIHLDKESIRVDVLEVLETRPAVEDACRALERPFLQGFSVGALEFQSWARAQQRQIETRLCDLIQDEADAMLRDRPQAAADALARLAAVDPLRECTHRSLMMALSLLGRPEAALVQFETCRDVLSRQLGIAPSKATCDLAARVRAERTRAQEAMAERAAFERFPEQRAVRVLRARGGDPRAADIPDAERALRDALSAVRDCPAERIAVVAASEASGERLLARSLPGQILVSEAVYDQFRHWSPFAFAPPLDEAAPPHYRLLSEEPRHRLQIAPSVRVPEAPIAAATSAVVLPLRDFSQAAEAFNLGDFLAEEITAALARFRGITVAAPTAAQTCRAFRLSGEQIRETLGVNYLVDGSVTRIGDMTQTSVIVSDLRDGHVLLSDQFEGSFEEVLRRQSLIVRRIANAVFRGVEAAEIIRSVRLLTEDTRAYDHFLKGLAAHRRAGISVINAHEAVTHFDNALARDPSFPRAIAWRNCAIGWFNPDYYLDRGYGELQWALSLDDRDPEVNRIAGILSMFMGDYDRCVTLLERAVSLNPSDAYLLASSAENWAFKGEPEKGLHHIDRAMALDPFLPAWCVEDHGVVLYTMGDFAGAAATLRRMSTPTPRSLGFLAASLVAMDRLDEARSTIEAALRMEPAYSFDDFMITNYYRRDADRRGLERRLAQVGLH